MTAGLIERYLDKMSATMSLAASTSPLRPLETASLDLRRRFVFVTMETLSDLMEENEVPVIGFIRNEAEKPLTLLGPQMARQECFEDRFEWEFEEWMDGWFAGLLWSIQDWGRSMTDLLPLEPVSSACEHCRMNSEEDGNTDEIVVLTLPALRQLMSEMDVELFPAEGTQEVLF